VGHTFAFSSHVTVDGCTGARPARPADGDVVSVHVCIDTSLLNSFHCEYISKVSVKFHFAFIYTFIAIKIVCQKNKTDVLLFRTPMKLHLCSINLS